MSVFLGGISETEKRHIQPKLNTKSERYNQNVTITTHDPLQDFDLFYAQNTKKFIRF